ncbi:Protein of unknown function [Cotesia congregata]|uniref:Uncharacterized protein n=1 Tax=Cotesia congregata TaxID=51543 RepID=A0A8J2HB17_COTCN|nr:Protein of unknown function [Cotesia congregata]
MMLKESQNRERKGEYAKVKKVYKKTIEEAKEKWWQEKKRYTRSADAPESLSKMLRELEKYVDKNELRVIAKKTKIIMFGNDGKEVNKRWCYKGEKLEVVNSFKYLDYAFTTKNSHSNHMEVMKNKANKVANATWEVINKTERNNIKDRMYLYNTVVTAECLYGVEIWGNEKIGGKIIMENKLLRIANQPTVPGKKNKNDDDNTLNNDTEKNKSREITPNFEERTIRNKKKDNEPSDQDKNQGNNTNSSDKEDDQALNLREIKHVTSGNNTGVTNNGEVTKNNEEFDDDDDDDYDIVDGIVNSEERLC